MQRQKLNHRKRIGLILLGVVLLRWVAVPIMPFFQFKHKAIIVTSTLVIGEVLFVITIALLGKEYWEKIKGVIKTWFRRGKQA